MLAFSLHPADYAERIAAQRDALKRNLSALVAQICAAASAAPRESPPSEAP